MATETIDEVLKERLPEIAFLNGYISYGTVMVRYVSEEIAKKYAIQAIKTNEWILYPMYLGKYIARIRAGSVDPDVRPEWIAASILNRTEGTKIIQVSSTQQFQRWGYGVEFFLSIEE